MAELCQGQGFTAWMLMRGGLQHGSSWGLLAGLSLLGLTGQMLSSQYLHASKPYTLIVGTPCFSLCGVAPLSRARVPHAFQASNPSEMLHTCFFAKGVRNPSAERSTKSVGFLPGVAYLCGGPHSGLQVAVCSRDRFCFFAVVPATSSGSQVHTMPWEGWACGVVVMVWEGWWWWPLRGLRRRRRRC